jgi:hypothetical protein
MRSGHRVGGRDPKLTVCGAGSVNTPAATSEASGIAGTRTLHHRAYERSERSFHHDLTLGHNRPVLRPIHAPSTFWTARLLRQRLGRAPLRRGPDLPLPCRLVTFSATMAV